MHIFCKKVDYLETGTEGKKAAAAAFFKWFPLFSRQTMPVFKNAPFGSGKNAART